MRKVILKEKVKSLIILVHFLIICSKIFSQGEDPIYFNNCVNNFFNNISKDYYQDFPRVENSPMDSCSNNIIDSRYLFKAVHHNQVLLDINEINKLNKQYVAINTHGTIIIHNLYVGIIRKGNIQYEKVDVIAKSLFSQLNKCDNVNFHVSDSTFTFEFCSYKQDEMFNSTGLIIFKDSLEQMYFKRHVDIVSYNVCQLDSNIIADKYEELTHYESIVLKFCNYKIRMQLSGVRDNKKDREFLYTNTIDLLKNDTIYSISFLGNNECIEGYFYGY